MEKGVGASLRDARSRRKLSLADVEAETKIRPRYLRALENEEWEELPGDIYARAFARTYAAFLGLDADRLAEEVRRDQGSERIAERLPRVEPGPRRAPATVAMPRIPVPPRVLAVLVSALLVGLLIVIGLAGQGGSGPSAGHRRAALAHRGHGAGGRPESASRPRAHRLSLLANAEVWVCLLGHGGKRLVDGLILAPGERAGPFRSGSFKMAFGNGAVTMTVDGRQAQIGESSGPIGFSVGTSGTVSELPEGERPSCT